MKSILLMNEGFVSYVDIYSICCLSVPGKYRDDQSCCTLVQGQWLYWNDNIEDVFDIIRDYIPLIELHHQEKTAYVNSDKICTIVRPKHKFSHCKGRTFIEGVWLDWDEDPEEIILLIEKETLKMVDYI
jgi:hypothetical protein